MSIRKGIYIEPTPKTCGINFDESGGMSLYYGKSPSDPINFRRISLPDCKIHYRTIVKRIRGVRL